MNNGTHATGVYLEKKDGRKRSDENERHAVEWHCHGGSKVAARNDALTEGRVEIRMAAVTHNERVNVSRSRVLCWPCTQSLIYVARKITRLRRSNIWQWRLHKYKSHAYFVFEKFPVRIATSN
jgi:hypothetical protein